MMPKTLTVLVCYFFLEVLVLGGGIFMYYRLHMHAWSTHVAKGIARAMFSPFEDIKQANKL